MTKTKKTQKTKKTKKAKEAVTRESVNGNGNGDTLLQTLIDHGDAAGLAPEGGESAESFQDRIFDKINDKKVFTDKDWGGLPEPTQLWFNALVKAKKDAHATSSKATKVSKSKTLKKAKETAKDKVKAVTGQGFKAGTNGFEICQLIAKAKKAMTLEQIVKAAEKKPIKSNSIPNRVKQVVTEGARPSGRYGGLFTEDDGKYTYIGPDLAEAEKAAAAKAKDTKPPAKAKTTKAKKTKKAKK